jgi:hypothetical protein
MMKHKFHLTLVAAFLIVLMGSTGGCVTIVTEQPAPTTGETTTAMPAINYFTASPQNISSGERTTLSWDVSAATTTDIQPDIGSVGSSGSLQLTPPATITYTLTATSQAGSTSSSVTITVMPAAISEPDLVITDIWLSGETIYYKIKNQGNAEAKASWSALYVFDLKEATAYADALAVGEEKTESFSNWTWPYPAPGAAVFGGKTKSFDVKVCADDKNEIEESDKSNNCYTVIWGPKFTYDFMKNAHLATWKSDAGDLKWPMAASDSKGAAYVQSNTIVMCPQQVSNGWILGRFAEYYSEDLGETQSREIEVPRYAKFTAKVGFNKKDSSTDGVRVALGYLDTTGSMVLFPKIDVYSDGTLRDYRIDLSDLAEKKTEFFLWVEAKDSPVGDCVSWVEPKIVQE